MTLNDAYKRFSQHRSTLVDMQAQGKDSVVVNLTKIYVRSVILITAPVHSCLGCGEQVAEASKRLHDRRQVG